MVCRRHWATWALSRFGWNERMQLQVLVAAAEDDAAFHLRCWLLNGRVVPPNSHHPAALENRNAMHIWPRLSMPTPLHTWHKPGRLLVPGPALELLKCLPGTPWRWEPQFVPGCVMVASAIIPRSGNLGVNLRGPRTSVALAGVSWFNVGAENGQRPNVASWSLSVSACPGIQLEPRRGGPSRESAEPAPPVWAPTSPSE